MRGSRLTRFGTKPSPHDRPAASGWGHQSKGGSKAQESRRPGEGPPDLDQLWRDFNARLNRLFGQRGDGGGPYRPDARGAGITAAIVLAIVALIWLASGAFIVQDGDIAVVRTFGKLSHTAGPGFNWRWPYPFQSHEIVPVAQVRVAEIGYRGNLRNKQPQEALMLTGDDNILDVQFAVQYKLKDPVAWLQNNSDQDDTVRQVAEATVRQLVGQSKMNDVLYAGRDRIAIAAQSAMQRLLDSYALGAQITSVTMLSVAPPEPVQGAFDDAVKAAQDALRARNEGQAYANDILPRAKGQAARLIEDAEAYRSMVVEDANGNAARFNQVVAEYAKAPAVTRTRMYLDTMQQIFSNTSKVLVDTKAGSNISLPLDKLVAQNVAADVAIASKSGAVPPQPQPQPQAQQQSAQEPPQSLESARTRDERSRDATLERERESR
jgi:membrane protease subunit HflK